MHTNAVNMHAQVLGWVHVITSLKYLSVNLSIMWWPRSWAFEKVPDYFSEYQSQGTKINFLKRHIYFERITDRPCIHSSAGSLDRPAPGQAEVRSLSWVSHRWQGFKHCGHLPLLSRATGKELDQKWGSCAKNKYPYRTGSTEGGYPPPLPKDSKLCKCHNTRNYFCF